MLEPSSSDDSDDEQGGVTRAKPSNGTVGTGMGSKVGSGGGPNGTMPPGGGGLDVPHSGIRFV